MKKRITIILTIALISVAVLCIFNYYHPTHFAYNDRFIIGNTTENIVEKYGEFYSIRENTHGDISCGIYKIRDNNAASFDNSLWYEILFENGIAVKVSLREGNAGG